MKQWKQIISIAALAMCGLFTAACGNQESATASNAGAAKTATSSANATQAAKADGKKILVAYFSASGNTKKIAETAATVLGADLYELKPAQPYTQSDLNYRNDASRVVKEHDDANRHVALANATPPNFADYDVVLVGAPMWWHEAAWPVNDFLTENDFTGKTVVPFISSYSDPLGDSGEKMAKLAGTGIWQTGACFTVSSSQSDVEEWAKGLKF